MIYSDEAETLGGLLACANKYAAVNTAEGSPGKRRLKIKPGLHTKSQLLLEKAAQVAESGRIKSRQSTNHPGHQR